MPPKKSPPFTFTLYDADDPLRRPVGELVSAESFEAVTANAMRWPWSPAAFKGNRRANANFLGEDVPALDVDNDDGRPPLTLEAAGELLHAAGLLAAVLTTKSHQKDKHGDGRHVDRFRVVLPLARRICTEAEHRATWATANTLLGGAADAATADPGRFYYAAPGLAGFTHQKKGKRFPVVGAGVPTPKAAASVAGVPTTGNRWPEGVPNRERFCRVALADEAAALARTPKGKRLLSAHRAAVKMGSLAGLAGLPAEGEALGRLWDAAVAAGLLVPDKPRETVESLRRELKRNLDNGWTYGLAHPRKPESVQ